MLPIRPFIFCLLWVVGFAVASCPPVSNCRDTATLRPKREGRKQKEKEKEEEEEEENKERMRSLVEKTRAPSGSDVPETKLMANHVRQSTEMPKIIL